MSEFEQRLRNIREIIANTKAKLSIEQGREKELLKQIKEWVGKTDNESVRKRLKEIDKLVLKNDNAMKKLMKQIEDELYEPED